MKKLFLVIGTLLILGIFFLLPNQNLNDKGYSQDVINSIVKSNNRFSFNLFKEMNNNTNTFFSPLSIYSAFAICYEGSNTTTREEMSKVFGFPEKEELRPNLAHIYNTLDKDIKLANAIWVQKGFPLLKSYTSNVKEYFGANARILDFIHKTEESRKTINNYISIHTNGKIKELIQKGVLNKLTRVVITNAIYFKGKWKYRFDKSLTKEMDFFTSNETIKVQMMHLKSDKAFNYSRTKDFEAIELPYKDSVSMVVVLTNKSMSYDLFNAILGNMSHVAVNDIYLPKFKIETTYRLNQMLENMGLRDSFTSKADFSEMTGKKDLFISDVIHKAYVEVDEEGTEAAAATAIVMKVTAMPDTIVFKADRPFYFFIINKRNNNILFFGRVVKI